MTEADGQQLRHGGYDAELQRHNEVLRRACRVGARDHVLDIGCGTGQTTLQAAHAAVAGRALGIDISASAIKRARELAQAQELRNVVFECADAQVYRFAPERFDLAMSRFGTMFFNDAGAAFANIWRALRPGGWLVMMVWQADERNEWSTTIRRSLDASDGSMTLRSKGPDPFSLADPPTVTDTLQEARFADVAFTDVREPVYYGPDVAAALDWVRGFACTSELLSRLEPEAAVRAVGRLREALAGHAGENGVWLDSRAWIVTARRD